MPVGPCVKGSVVAGHAEALVKYLASHPTDPKLLARRFPDGEVAFLSKPISTGAWYELRMYQRLLEFLRDFDGREDNTYLLEAGRRSAESLIRSGFYQQLEYVGRTQHKTHMDPDARFQAFGRDLRLLCTLTLSIFNFVKNSIVVDPDHAYRWINQYNCTAPFPEVMCWTTQGFCNRMAEEHGSRELWYWKRLTPEVVQFRMHYSV
jgi:hypothetical protein